MPIKKPGDSKSDAEIRAEAENLILEVEIVRLGRLLRSYRYTLLYLVVMMTIAFIIQVLNFLR